MERQDVDSKHGHHRSGTFHGNATRRLMSHEVMFAVLRGVWVWSASDPTCDSACVRIAQRIGYESCFFLCLGCWCVYTHASTVRTEEPGQLIPYVRCPRWPPRQQLVAHPHLSYSQNGLGWGWMKAARRHPNSSEPAALKQAGVGAASV